MISPEKMIRQIVAELQGDRKVSLNIDSSVLEMQTDRTALQLVLKELIQNAMFFNPSDKSTIDISVSEKNDSYEFVVADNGPGIKPQHQKIRNKTTTSKNYFRTFSNTSVIGSTLIRCRS